MFIEKTKSVHQNQYIEMTLEYLTHQRMQHTVLCNDSQKLVSNYNRYT